MKRERFFDGPFSAPTSRGPAQVPSDLLDFVPSLAQVLETSDPSIPALRDFSYRCDEPMKLWGGRMSHWVDWTTSDTALVASTSDSGVVALVEELIARWSWAWPDVAAQVLPLRMPDFLARLTQACASDPRYKRKRHGFRRDWLDTALHEGLFEHFRTSHRWPDPVAQHCGSCGRLFAPETLSHWMRQYGPARYCASCCCRARNGCVSHSADAVRSAVRDATAALGFIPAQDIAGTADLNSLEGPPRDRAMAALICLPEVRAAATALGITQVSGRWLAILQACGVVGDAWRPAMGTMCFAQDGHACRSLGERSIDDFMARSGIEHIAEPHWPIHPTINPDGRLRADWRLRDGTLVEYVGLMETASYRQRIAEKTLLAADLNQRLLVISPEDLQTLDKVFERWFTVPPPRPSRDDGGEPGDDVH